MQLDETFDGGEQAIPQAAVVRAACTGGDQVDIALTHRSAVFGEGHSPGSALAFSKALAVAIGKALTLKQRDHRVPSQRLRQVVTQTGFVLPLLGFLGFFIHQGHRHARHEHGFAAQQVRQLVHGQGAGFEVFGVRPGAHGSALLAVTLACGAFDQRLGHVATRKHQGGHLAFSVAGGLQALGQRIGHAHAHAVQAAREAVGPTLALVELAARMQAGEDQLDHRGVFFGVQAKGDAPAIVFDADRAIQMQDDFDFFAVTRQRLVGGVVQHFLDDVQGVVGAGVHARALLDGLQALQDADRAFGVLTRCFDS